MSDASGEEWQLDVLKRGQYRNEIVELEDEADLVTSEPRQLLIIHLRNVFAVYHGTAGGRLVQCSDYVEKCGLARAGGSHDNHELALVKDQTDSAQGLDRGAA